MEVVTLRTIVLVLLGISVLWFIRVLIKRENENIIRSVIFIVILGGGWLYLQQTSAERVNFADIKNQIKDKLFPEKMPQYAYHKEEGRSGIRRFVRYIFEDPGPKLALTLDKSQKYLHITDVSSVNRVLEYLGLQKVKSGVPELASLTGSRYDVSRYRWEDYPGGTLVIERSFCQDRDKVDSYNCILIITITR